MFTGIVEELGHVAAFVAQGDGARITIACATVLDDATIGASIAINGCCVTVVDLAPDGWTADLAPETLTRTTLGHLRVGDPVNLERPVRLTDRLGGHLVQGHVDAVGTVTAVTGQADGSTRITVRAPDALRRYVVEKGSVAIDGVSLTITGVTGDEFGVALIPHTLTVTTFAQRGIGDEVNLEADVIAKYVERLLEPIDATAPRR
jgi:riboflavin synthase